MYHRSLRNDQFVMDICIMSGKLVAEWERIMKRVPNIGATVVLGLISALVMSLGTKAAFTQSPAASSSSSSANLAKPMTIPITIRVKGITPEPELQMIDLTVSEDGEPQTILS